MENVVSDMSDLLDNHALLKISVNIRRMTSATNIHMLTHKGETVTDPLHIANIFHDYFSSITEKN